MVLNQNNPNNNIMSDNTEKLINLFTTTTLTSTLLGPRSDIAGAPGEIPINFKKDKSIKVKEINTHVKDEEMQDGGDIDEPGTWQTFSEDYMGGGVRIKAVQEKYFDNPEHTIDLSLDHKVYSKQESLIVLQQMDIVYDGHVEKVKDVVTNNILVRKKVSEKDFYYGELQVLKDLNSSDYILKLLGYVHDGNSSFFILLEDAGESLDRLVAKRSADKRYDDVLDKLPSIVQSILLALVYLNEKGYVHCDIQPESICVKEGITKLIDFGCCNRISDTKNDNCTWDYMSPEQLQHRNESDNEDYSVGSSKYKPDHKSDMWAAFMVFLFIVKKDVPAKLFRNLKGKEIEDLTDPIDPFFIDGPMWLQILLQDGLKVKVEDRYTAEQCLVAISKQGVIFYEPKIQVCKKPNSMKKIEAVTHPQQETISVAQPNRTRFTIVKNNSTPSIPLVDQTGDLTSIGLDPLQNEVKAQDESSPVWRDQNVMARMSNASESSASASGDDGDICIF